jgi:asparagine synthase (glutamine-hydrolysing)
MCGILGGFWREESPGAETRFSVALNSLTHRGPDDHGVWSDRIPPGYLALGHRRLSIIDLSDAGHQPMHSQDGRYTIVFNGEIYNYKELRTDLRQAGFDFRSNSDTEVLLYAWHHWGKSCLTRLIGMFAFAVDDKIEQTLTLVRDAFGIKPLFFSHNQDRFLFASEMPALLALGGQTPELNPQRVYDYLIHGVHDTGFDTFVHGVSHVPPAHLVRYDLVDPGRFVSERWWNPNITQTLPLSFAQAAEALREVFL